MTREDAKVEIRKAHWDLDNPGKKEELVIDDIYDDFESRVCKNCSILKSLNYCLVLDSCIAEPKVFGCNKFEVKDDT